MGYSITLQNSRFHIREENFGSALKAIQEIGAESKADPGANHFAWVDTKSFREAGTVWDAISAWRWEVFTEGEDRDMFSLDDVPMGDIVDISFRGVKLGDDRILFDALAPWVEAGSFLEMQGEDGLLWRWVFDGKTCREIVAKIVWEE